MEWNKLVNNNHGTVFSDVAKFAHLLRWFGDPILRTSCQEISPHEMNTLEIQELAQKLIAVLKQIRYVTGIGRGLAAPQIGVPKRMVAIFQAGEYQILVNPKISHISKEQGVYPEMCLSGMPISANVVRPWRVDIEYQDMSGHYHNLSADPMLSRLLQHEIDHLSGILFIDKADVQSISFVSDFETYKTQSNLIQLQQI